MYESCVENPTATVVRVTQKETRKWYVLLSWNCLPLAASYSFVLPPRCECVLSSDACSRPYPLTTVNFQKLAAKKLRMSSERAMQIAEDLYNKGQRSHAPFCVSGTVSFSSSFFFFGCSPL